MNCPHCGKDTTIIHCNLNEISVGRTHYCWGIPNPEPNSYAGIRIYSQGTEPGCCMYLMKGWEGTLTNISPEPLDPLDPWGVPVDTRGYPKDMI